MIEVILRMNQAGFFQKWYNHQVWNATQKRRFQLIEEFDMAEENTHKKIGVEEVLIGFIILIIGYGLSIIVWCIELLYYKFRNRKIVTYIKYFNR